MNIVIYKKQAVIMDVVNLHEARVCKHRHLL